MTFEKQIIHFESFEDRPHPLVQIEAGFDFVVRSASVLLSSLIASLPHDERESFINHTKNHLNNLRELVEIDETPTPDQIQ